MRRVVRWLLARRSILFELAGFALVVAAAARISVELGLFAAGIACFNFAFDRHLRRRGDR